MKATFLSLISLAVGALGQNGSTIAYSTSYWTECSGSTIGTGLRTGTAIPDITQTATNIYTQTYCPHCTHTTIWSTAYAIFCPTGLTTQAYLVTATASGIATPTWSTAPTDLPPGFTAAVQICTVCGPETITQIMTYPATTVPYRSGMPGAPTPAPAASAADNSAAPAGEGAAAPAGGSSAVPAAAAAAPACPGPQCQGGYAAATAAPNTNTNTTGGSIPFQGSATALSLGTLPMIIALGAFLL